MRRSSESGRKDIFAAFDPSRPDSTLPARSYPYGRQDDDDDDVGDDDEMFGLFRGPRQRRKMFLVRWPDDSIAIMTSPSKQSLMMTLDEIADPGMALICPWDGPLYMEIEPSRKISTQFTLEESQLSRRAPPRLLPRTRARRKKKKMSIGELFISGRFSDFSISVHKSDGSGTEAIRCHKVLVRDLLPISGLLESQPEAKLIHLENLPHLTSGFVRLALQFHYGVKLDWNLIRPTNLQEQPPPDAHNLPVFYSATEGNISKWIDALALAIRTAKAFGLPGFAEAVAQRMRVNVSGFALEHPRTIGISDEREQERKTDSLRRIPFRCRLVWNLARKVTPLVKRLGVMMRNSVKHALPEEEAFRKVLTDPSEEDVSLYRQAQVREYDASMQFSNAEYKAKLIGDDLDDGQKMVESIEKKLYPHRYYVKKLSQRVEEGAMREEDAPDWGVEMRRAVKLDEDFLETKTGYQKRRKKLESSDDFLSQLMLKMDLTSPGVLSDMVGPVLSLLPGTKRPRDPKDSIDEDEPPAKRQKTE